MLNKYKHICDEQVLLYLKIDVFYIKKNCFFFIFKLRQLSFFHTYF